MLTLVIPARTAATSPSSGTPDEPCSTSGTGTERRSAAMRSVSSCAVRSVIAWLLPTATASALTPVSATNRAASSGSVRTPGAWTPSLPPTSPSSASTLTPAARQSSTTRRVTARFSSSGSVEPSNITDVSPSRTASSTSETSSAWSRWTTTGCAHASAMASVAAAIGASAPW